MGGIKKTYVIDEEEINIAAALIPLGKSVLKLNSILNKEVSTKDDYVKADKHSRDIEGICNSLAAAYKL